MKADRRQIERALDAPDAATRLYLLHGPDESGSRALADRLARAMGPEAERIDLASALLRGDPARLADEAASGSLFGGARHIRVEPAFEDCAAAVDALLEAPAAGNPVVLVAGTLKRESALLKAALAADRALAFASYLPEGADADRLAATLAREQGLTLRPDVAHRLALSTGGDRALLARELEKLALYLDATPEQPRELGHDALDRLGIDLEEGDLARLVDAVLAGEGETVEAELRQMTDAQAVQIVRGFLTRLNLLAGFSAQVAGGETVHGALTAAGKSLFWRDKDVVRAQLGRWRPELITRLIERMGEAERAAKSSGGLGLLALEHELNQIVRQAARLR